MIASLILTQEEQTHEAAAAAGAHAAEAGEHGASEVFNAAETIIGHVSNSTHDHPLIHLPTLAGIDFSVTKHVLMLWLVAVVLFVLITIPLRRYLKKDRLVPTGFAGVLEYAVEFIRDSIVQPNVGKKWVMTWTPFVLTLFFFILGNNAIGMIPVFDFVGALGYFIGASHESFLMRAVHGGTTATGNFNVTAGLATITFFAIITAGSKAHGFVKHWYNLVPHGLHPLIYVLLIPIELMGMIVKPFALTMRLAANMTGGHVAILSILSLVLLFAEKLGAAAMAIGLVSVPLAVGISGLEIIVVLVQAYVFTLLSAVFIGMAIHVHH